MNYKNFIYIIVLLGITPSCTDLEVVNKAALPQEIALGNTSDFEAILFGAYESVNDFVYYGQRMMIAPEIMADNMRLHNFTNGRYTGEYVNAINSGVNIWARALNLNPNQLSRYYGINQCNIVINLIEDEAIEGNPETKAELIAEAKFLRALFYHDLARVYGYEPGQEVNGFNLSAVIRTEPVLGLSDADDRPRSTNVEVYELIEADLLEAIPDLPSAAVGSADVARANADAARLLLARVYLYWGRNADAANFAQQVITGDGTDLVIDSLYIASWDDAVNIFHPESLFESDLRIPDWDAVDGLNNSLHSITMNDTQSAQFVLVASDELIAEIESNTNDVRINMFNDEAPGKEFAKWQGNKGTVPFQENIPILRLSEAYLIAAEALGAGAGDNILNAFRERRGMTTAVTANVDNVLREKRIEYMAEGHRYFDLKRLGRNILKPAAAGIGPSLPYTDFKVLGRIPQSDVSLSADILVQNPGYN